MSKRVIMRIEIAPSSKAGLDHFCEATGMTKLAAVSRLIDWFCEQDETLQAMVQHLVPVGIEVDVAKLILQHMCNGNGAAHRTAGNGHRPRAARSRSAALGL